MFAFSLVYADFEQELTFERTRLKLIWAGEFTKIIYDGCELIGAPGEPELPVLPVSILLPPYEKALKVEYEIISQEEIEGTHRIYPAQKPAILPIPGLPTRIPDFTPPDKTIYSSDRVFPEQIVKLGQTSFLRGKGICGLIVYPVYYKPLKGKLFFITRLKIKIQTVNENINLPRKESLLSRKRTEKFLDELVYNKEMVRLYENLIPVIESAYDYLIITDDSFYRMLQPYRTLLHEKGLNDTIITITMISREGSGRDLAEKMRNKIREIYENFGIYYVLLCGDVSLVPSRVAFAMDCEAGYFSDENDIHTDYYFSCLDGNWNYDENDTFGSVSDSVDLYPELFVGRIPASTREHINTFITKSITYNNSPPVGYLTKSLFACDILWWDPYTDSGIGKDLVMRLFPPHFEIERLYESIGNENLSNVVSSITRGKGVFNHYGHGFIHIMGVGSGEYLDSYTAQTLTNNDKLGLGLSIGCWVGAFDYSNCIAEDFVNNPNGGTIAFIANNRYGWGSPGNPGFGYSEKYDYCFFDAVFKKGIKTFGEALAFCKAYYAPLSGEANLFRWHEYQINLLGEPSTTLWTNEPATMTAIYPSSVPQTIRTLTAILKDESGAPIHNASITLIQRNTILGRAISDINGIATIGISSPLNSGNAYISCVKEDFRKIVDTINVLSDDAHISMGYYMVICEDGITRETEIPTGTTDTLFFSIVNDGTIPTDSGTVVIEPSSPISIEPTYFTLPSLAPSETILYKAALTIPVNMRNPIRIVVYITTGSSVFNQFISLLPIYPYIRVKHYLVYGSENYLIPGTVSLIRFLFRNDGQYRSPGYEVSINPLSSHISLPVRNITLGHAAPFEVITHEPIEIHVSGDAFSGDIIPVEFIFTGDDGTRFADTLDIVVGRFLFFDDAEGESELNHTGSPDLWSKTTRYSHSGIFSYGYTSERGYPPFARATLFLPPLTLQPGAILSFWVYYNVAIYGNDGLYVKVVHEIGDTTTIDYLGSGGALPILPGFSVGWNELTYELQGRPGEQFQILFEFVSDSGQSGEGVFIDDIKVYVPYENASSINNPHETPQELFKIYPNPSNSAFTIECHTSLNSLLEIFNIKGERLKRTVILPGTNRLKFGYDLPSGIYFVRVSNNKIYQVKRCTILK